MIDGGNSDLRWCPTEIEKNSSSLLIAAMLLFLLICAWSLSGPEKPSCWASFGHRCKKCRFFHGSRGSPSFRGFWPRCRWISWLHRSILESEGMANWWSWGFRTWTFWWGRQVMVFWWGLRWIILGLVCCGLSIFVSEILAAGLRHRVLTDRDSPHFIAFFTGRHASRWRFALQLPASWLPADRCSFSLLLGLGWKFPRYRSPLLFRMNNTDYCKYVFLASACGSANRW